MELALGPYDSGLITSIFFCFNPCFCGTCPRTLLSGMNGLSSSGFNPCFCGTCPRTVCVGHVVAFQDAFQSLFLWNLPSDSFGLTSSSNRSQVSILVFVELALGRSSQPLGSNNQVSFNPCFCGTCPRTLAYSSFRWPGREFQSLFLWNLPSDIDCPCYGRLTVMFQSLFLWNLPSDSADFSSFSSFLGVKPAFSYPPAGMR